MRTREEQRARRLVTCRHFNGLANELCEAGVRYRDLFPPGRDTLGCIREWGEDHCDDYSPRTEEELDAEDAELERTLRLIGEGKSPCCEAPIDESQVIRSGRHKGHGLRFCSKCGACVYVV